MSPPSTARRQAAHSLDPRISRGTDGHVEPPDPVAVCRVIRRLREEANLTQVELARKIGLPQSYVSRWELNRVPRLDDLYRIEVDGLGVLPGSILREAGFILGANDVEQAIATDTRLRPAMRPVIVAAYRAAVG